MSGANSRLPSGCTPGSEGAGEAAEEFAPLIAACFLFLLFGARVGMGAGVDAADTSGGEEASLE